MLKSYEHWFGPYPFYEDGYKIVDAPGFGMEHQSAIAYANEYVFGNRGNDYTGTGWGLRWDFLIVHESAHEWFGNSITASDPAEKWIHESFGSYADVLYIDDNWGIEAGNQYAIGFRKLIRNDRPVIGPYDVSREGSTDMYPKGRNMIHMIRQVINDDEKFRQLLMQMNIEYYHKIVTSGDIEGFINQYSGINFSPVFEQYLRHVQVPVLEFCKKQGRYFFRFTNCIKEFTVPVKVKTGSVVWVKPTTAWQSIEAGEKDGFTVDENFFIGLKRVADLKGLH
jgi:aminopeptidase N